MAKNCVNMNFVLYSNRCGRTYLFDDIVANVFCPVVCR